MNPPLERRIDVAAWGGSRASGLLSREWLVSNGLGGYASSTVVGTLTRRYHGLLIAALPPPWGRVMSLVQISEMVEPEGWSPFALSTFEAPGCSPDFGCVDLLKAFVLEDGLPRWEYEAAGYSLDKSIFMSRNQNTVHIRYLLREGPSRALPLRLAPYLHFRPHGADVDRGQPGPYEVEEDGEDVACLVCRPSAASPQMGVTPLRFVLSGADRRFDRAPASQTLFYRTEAETGYPAEGTVWSPGQFVLELRRGEPVTLTASMEEWDCLQALPPVEAERAERRRRSELLASAGRAVDGRFAAELILAADQFLMIPAGKRPNPLATAEERGQTEYGAPVSADAPAGGLLSASRSVIAGYHWFTDWGRDTMISLEGLCLIPGRLDDARKILGTFAAHMRDGLIPNLFPEGGAEARYNTADATLWFVHALDRYRAYTGELGLLAPLLPALRELISYHVTGTLFGIGVDPDDGLLRQGAEGVALTWMDAKMDDWVVTPRRGKAVEINALWYNALRVIAAWSAEEGRPEEAQALGELADTVRASFNRRFWYDSGGYLYDVVDGPLGDDAACRPNQVLSVALPHPVLDESRWEAVVEVVRQQLLTPFGLRTLAPGDPQYAEKYRGYLRARDGAYHQGTVWPWLIGPFIDAWLKLHPDDRAGARQFLDAFDDHLSEACIGSISEVFDATPPFVPGGCVAQAWSVAEVLRSWLKTGNLQTPERRPERSPSPARSNG